MFLPPQFPESVAPEYVRYRSWSMLSVATECPKAVVVSMAFWAGVYGVGDSSSSPMKAVLLDIFLVSVDAIVGLVAGVPMLSERLNYAAKHWKLLSGLLGIAGEITRLAAALSGGRMFYPLVVLSVFFTAFGSTSGKYMNAEIERNWSRSDQVGLVDINITSANQALVAKLLSSGMCVSYLFHLVGTSYNPLRDPTYTLCTYGALQLLCSLSQLGQFLNIPDVAPYEKHKKDLIDSDAHNALAKPKLELETKSKQVMLQEPSITTTQVRALLTTV